MRKLLSLGVAASLAGAAACGDVRDATPDATPGDDTDAEPPPGELDVELSPAGPHYVSESVDLEVEVTGDADAVLLLRDGNDLAELGDDRSYTWDVSEVDEGSYDVTAEVSAGDDSASSAVVTVHVDKTAPTIVERAPEAGDDDVAVREAISVSFSDPLAPSTVTDETVVLSDSSSETIEIERALSEDGHTLELEVAGTILTPEDVTLEVTSELTDRAGNAFEGESWSWSSPVWLTVGEEINSSSGTVGESRIVFDEEERPVVAHLEQGNDDFYYVYVRRWEDDQWTTLGDGSLNHSISDSELGTSVHIDKNDAGELYVHWREGSGALYLSRWTGSSWDDLGGDLHADPGDGSLGWEFGFDDAAFPVMSWIALKDSGDYELAVRRWTGDEMETLTDALFTGEVGSDNRQFITADGDPLLVYNTGTEPDELHAQVWDPTAEAFDSLTGGDPLNVEATAEAREFVAEQNGDDELFVAWHERSADGEDDRLYGRYGDREGLSPMGSGGFNEDPDLPLYGSAGSADMQMVLDEEGHPVVVWGEGDELDDAAESHWYAKRWDGADWELLGGEAFHVGAGAVRPRDVVVGGDGEPLVSLRVDLSGTSALFVYSFDGASWDRLGGSDPIVEDETLTARSLYLMPDDTPVVFVEAGSDHDDQRLHVLEYRGGEWQQVGGHPVQHDPSQHGNFQAVEPDGLGLPTVTWSEDEPGEFGAFSGDLYMRRLNR